MSTPGTRTLWNVPYQRNPFFTGREEILSRLDRALHSEQRVALSQPQGITGLGGIGKTQTVVEYAYRHQKQYDAVLWIRAESVTSLISSMIELAQILELPERNEQNQDIIIQAVWRWLRLHSDWLLIYDNIDDLSLAEPLLPKVGAGHLLFTTRAHALGGLAQRLDLQQMEPDIGALLLLRRASLLALQATLNMAKPDEQRLAGDISQELDGLPLALDQAGAYIKETSCSLADYAALYQTRRREILQARVGCDEEYPASVATTWSLSFEKINQANAAAAELLNFCSFLAPDAIPEEMIAAGAQHLTPALQKVVAHPLQFDQAIATLLAYSLVGRDANATLNIHRLVQAVLQDMLEEAEKRVWAERATLVVNAAFPNAKHENWPQCERMLSQALLAAQYIETQQIIGLDAGRLLHDTATYLQEYARYQEAEPLYELALRLWEQSLGSEDPQVAKPLNNLANIYIDQGKYAKAELLHQRAMRIREQALGSEDPEVAHSLNNLANLYLRQGKYAEAEPLYQSALRIWEQKLGLEDSLVAYPLTNLGHIYYELGRYAEAEPHYQRALRIREQTLGPEDPEVAHPLNGLANLYLKLGKYAEAEPLYRRALHISEQKLGLEHLLVAKPLNNLGDLYLKLGKSAEAEPLFLRALHIREQQLGAEHPDVAYPLHNLGDLYLESGKSAEAELFYQRALLIFEQTLGQEHHLVAYPLNGLANLYLRQEKYAEAEPLYQRALRIRERKFGLEHPDTIEILRSLAQLYAAQSNNEKA